MLSGQIEQLCCVPPPHSICICGSPTSDSIYSFQVVDHTSPFFSLDQRRKERMVCAEEHPITASAPVQFLFNGEILFITCRTRNRITDEAKFFWAIGNCIEVKLSKVETCIMFQTRSNNGVMIDARCKTRRQKW